VKLRFFKIPIQNPDPFAAEANAFLTAHRVAQIDRQFVADGGNSFWTICVTYLDTGTRPTQEKRSNTDYRDALPEAQFRVFAKLRTLRKELAEKEGVPAYALFTNEQLAEMVRRGASSLTALKTINGVGQARAEKYGEAFLAVLRENPVAPTSRPQESTNGEAG
jgi:superfamily II DNA helicase RecQ